MTIHKSEEIEGQTGYDSSNIRQMSDIDHIRLRPHTYADNNGASGQRILLKEIVDNSIDELEECGGVGEVCMVLFRDLESMTYQVAVRDNGRGIPPNSLIDVFTKAKMGGKFDQDAYKFSAGLNGVGSTVVMALSSYFRALSFRNGFMHDSGILNHADILEDRTVTSTKYESDLNRHGTTVIYSPDKDIFNEIPEFMIDEVNLIFDYFAKMSLFVDFGMKFTIVDTLIPKEILFGDGLTLTRFVDSHFDGNANFDKNDFQINDYLRRTFGVKDDFEFGIGINYSNTNRTLLLDGTCNITFTPLRSSAICSVNNIVFTDAESYHYTLLQNFLKKSLKTNIDDIKVRQFFEKRYTVPLWLYLNIKFAGARFSGMEKRSFKDTNFREPYLEALSTIFTEDILTDIYSTIEEHLREAYTRYVSRELKVGHNGILSQLNFPLSFTDCSTDNPEERELFIVEGLSARQKEARDPNTQAFYAVRGKMFNAVDTSAENDVRKAREKLINDPLYSDIIKILNLGPSLTTDNLAYRNIFLMSDADIHGHHIANILLSNLYIICPELLLNGHINIVKAPLYKIRTGSNSPQLFARDHQDLLVGLANRIYYHIFEITLVVNGKEKILSKDDLVGFVGWVYQMGDYVTSVSKEYFVEPIILEQLAIIADKLDNPDSVEISKILNIPVKYDRETDVLSCSIGIKDIYVPLSGIREVIRTSIVPELRDFVNGNVQILVTTKKDSQLKRSRLSVIRLYEIFKKLQGSLAIEKMKGLASMSKNEKIATCMDKTRRRVYKITSLGEAETIFNLMGKDSKYRKALLDG